MRATFAYLAVLGSAAFTGTMLCIGLALGSVRSRVHLARKEARCRATVSICEDLAFALSARGA